jgi:hypothetical protein
MRGQNGAAALLLLLLLEVKRGGGLATDFGRYGYRRPERQENAALRPRARHLLRLLLLLGRPGSAAGGGALGNAACG